MREIKFRAFLGGVMHPEWTRIDEDVYKTHPDIKIMQVTGLVDKNGKEIYESDLVKSSKSIYEVIWNNEYARWGLLKSNGKFPVAIHHGAKTLEVIGNIYSNPEFLPL